MKSIKISVLSAALLASQFSLVNAGQSINNTLSIPVTASAIITPTVTIKAINTSSINNVKDIDSAPTISKIVLDQIRGGNNNDTFLWGQYSNLNLKSNGVYGFVVEVKDSPSDHMVTVNISGENIPTKESGIDVMVATTKLLEKDSIATVASEELIKFNEKDFTSLHKEPNIILNLEDKTQTTDFGFLNAIFVVSDYAALSQYPRDDIQFSIKYDVEVSFS